MKATMRHFLCASIALVCLFACTFAQGEEKVPAALDFTMKNLDGKDVKLSDYKDNVVLVVNVASECGLTPQYKQLQALHDEYAEKGLIVLGFPCNQFGKQEPGTSAEIKSFCTDNYGVTFPMMAKVEVNGEDACDFYQHLTKLDLEPKGPGKISWNFEKFVIGKGGEPVARFEPRTEPNAKEVLDVIDAELAKD